MMVAGPSLLLTLTVAVFLAVAQLPRPHSSRETLGVVGGAVEAVLARERRPHCSVILLTDGTTSATTVFMVLTSLWAPFGEAVFEVAAKGKNFNVTQTQLSRVIGEARRMRLASWCVTVVVVSDDPTFLIASAEWSLKGRLLTWFNKFLAVTRRPLEDLRRLYTYFSMRNAMLVIVDTTASFPSCNIYVHLPYRPPEAQIVRVASWTTLRGLTLATHIPLFPEKFLTFAYGPEFVAVAEEYPSYVEKELTWVPGQPLNYGGPLVQLLRLLAVRSNFTFSMVRPPDGKWGTKEPDGTWSGMVGMVGRKEADIGIGPFAISGVRAQMVDFTSLVVVDRLKMIGGLGRPEVDPWGFFLPLGPSVWTAILVALLVVPGMVLLLLLCFPRQVPQRDSWRIDNIFLYIRVLLQQGYSPEPGEWGWERLMLGSWMIMTLLFVRGYDGNLMSMLAVRYIPQPYQSLRDVMDDTSATMIWEAGTVYIEYFRTLKSGIFREVMDSEKDGRLLFVTTTDYMGAAEELVTRGDHVLVVEENTGRSLRSDLFSRAGQCDYYTSREDFLPVYMSMIGQKDHPLVPAMSRRIRLVTESGIFEYWMKSLKLNATRCLRPPTKITVKSSLAISNLWGMFVVLAGGNGVALLMLCLELIAARLTETQSSFVDH